jgi:hypothetical protein
MKWEGEEKNEPVLLGVVTQSLSGRSSTQQPIVNHAIECTQGLLEFYMYATYTLHDDATLSCMENTSRCVHPNKDIFLLGWVSNIAKTKANTLRTELMKKWNVDDKACAET